MFVDLFSTTKVAIVRLDRLSKLIRAKIVPLFSMYNSEIDLYELDFYLAKPSRSRRARCTDDESMY